MMFIYCAYCIEMKKSVTIVNGTVVCLECLERIGRGEIDTDLFLNTSDNSKVENGK